MKVLLSIKPCYANRIFNGDKIYEYRKYAFKNNVETIIVYASAPVKMVIGEFTIDEIIKDTPTNIWSSTHEYGGIEKNDFFSYFMNKRFSYAIKIKNYKLYNTAKKLTDFGINAPPQSFYYLRGAE